MPANPQAPEVVVEQVDRQTYVDFVSHEAKSPLPEYRMAEILSGGSDDHPALRLLAFARHRTQALATVPPGVGEDADLARAKDALGFALRFDPPKGKEWRHVLKLDDAVAIYRALCLPADEEPGA